MPCFAAIPPGGGTVVKVPNSVVGIVIGKGGETIKMLQQKTGARIQIAKVRAHTRHFDRSILTELRAVRSRMTVSRIARSR